MSIFTFQNNKVVIDQEALVIPEFKEIYKRDKSKDKSKAFEELAYVYFYNDLKSPYKNLSSSERLIEIRKDYISDPKWTPDELVQGAILKYAKLQETPSVRYLNSTINAADKLIEYFNSIDWDERTEKGFPVFKVTEVVNALAKADDIRSSLQNLREKVEQEISSKTVRGGGNISKREE